MTFFNRYLSKEQAKLNFKTTLLILKNELSMVKTMSHCSGATSFEVGIENVKSVSYHLPLPYRLASQILSKLLAVLK